MFLGFFPEGSNRVLHPLLVLAACLTAPPVSHANPPVYVGGTGSPEAVRRAMKEMGAPNPIDRVRILLRIRAQQARRALRAETEAGPIVGEGPEVYGLSGSDRVLVILVEFAG